MDSTQLSNWQSVDHCWVAACVCRFPSCDFALCDVSGFKVIQLRGAGPKRFEFLLFLNRERNFGFSFNLTKFIFLITNTDTIIALVLERCG